MRNNKSGLYSFKFKDTYYAFFNEKDSEYHNLGKKIATELKSMTSKDYTILQNLVNKLPRESNIKWDDTNYKGILAVLHDPKKFHQVEPELVETNAYSKMYYPVDYVYIIDLDQYLFTVKKIIYDKRILGTFPTIDKEDIQTFNLNNIPEFWL